MLLSGFSSLVWDQWFHICSSVHRSFREMLKGFRGGGGQGCRDGVHHPGCLQAGPCYNQSIKQVLHSVFYEMGFCWGMLLFPHLFWVRVPWLSSRNPPLSVLCQIQKWVCMRLRPHQRGSLIHLTPKAIPKRALDPLGPVSTGLPRPQSRPIPF